MHALTCGYLHGQDHGHTAFMSNGTQQSKAAEQRQQSYKRAAELPGHLHTSQVMRLFGVSQATVLKWHETGMMEADTPPGGKRTMFRWPRSRVVAFAQENRLELNLEAIGIKEPTV